MFGESLNTGWPVCPGGRKTGKLGLLFLVVAVGISVGQEGSLVDEGWPKTYTSGLGEMIVYQPQIDSWENDIRIEASMAVQVIPVGKETGTFGAAKIRARTETNFQTRLVLLKKIELMELRFPGADDETKKQCRAVVDRFLDDNKVVPIALDRLIAAMDLTRFQARVVDVNLDPPPIFYSSKPAVLVLFMGDPRFEKVEGTGLLFCVNTNWDLLLDPTAGTYFLRIGESWITTRNLEKGPWTPAQELPADFRTLPDDENWAEVKKAVPGKPIETAPEVFTCRRPAELIVVTGEPSFSPIPDTSLMEITNTDRDVFLDAGENKYYFLTAGRWFRADSLEGPWSAATEDLPEDFARIPPDHPKGYVLASVPGTEQAEAAVLQASIPETATVNRKGTTVEVVYDGEPLFDPIENTEVSFAVNTPFDVFKVGGGYYCCYNGIWFCSSSPNGPWEICDTVPEEIYSIPPDHPKYNVTYVYVYESTPDTVTVGYTSGYTGAFITGTGLVTFGLGYWLADEWWDEHWHYCHLHPWFYGYGCGVRYDYYHGGFYRNVGYYGPYGGAGRHALYDPATGTYVRSAYVYGPSGGAFAKQAYNPYTNRYAARAGMTTPYGSWGSTVVSDGSKWAAVGHRSGPSRTVVGGRTSEGSGFVAGKNKLTGEKGFVGKTSQGDVYVGKDGNLYRRQEDGSWQQYDQGSWNDIQPPQNEKNRAAVPDQLKNVDRSPLRENLGNTDRNKVADRFQNADRLKRSHQIDIVDRNLNRHDRGPQFSPSRLNREYRARQIGQQRSRNYGRMQTQGGLPLNRDSGIRTRSMRGVPSRGGGKGSPVRGGVGRVGGGRRR